MLKGGLPRFFMGVGPGSNLYETSGMYKALINISIKKKNALISDRKGENCPH